MTTRSFFYVCAGVLMLVVAYHLGVSSAKAQTTPSLIGIVGVDESTSAHLGAGLDSAGRIFWRDGQGMWQLAASQAPAGVPVDFLQAGQMYWIAMANGDVYTIPGGTNLAQPFQFTYLGNVLGGTIAVNPATMGEVKAKY